MTRLPTSRRRRRSGFTILELVVVISVGAILMTFATQAFGSVSRRLSVRQARNTFAAMHARTRAHAIEFGTNVEFHVDANGDSAWITRRDTILERMRFDEEFDVDLRAPGGGYHTLCMSPRGYGDTGCTTITGVTTFAFQQGADTMVANVFPLGQIIMPGTR